jgi:phosphatidylinositol-bisphosphatase
MGSNSPPSDLNPLVLPESVIYMPDIFVFGIQEAPQGDFYKEWEYNLQKTIGPTHVLLHSVPHGALHMAIFVRRYLIWYISLPEDETHNTRSPCAIPMLKTKGCNAITFRIFGTSFLFINSHFPAHETQIKRRIDEYENIITSISLPKEISLLMKRYKTRLMIFKD